MRAVGAYIFAGGFTLGIRDRFEVAMHLEESNYGVRTAALNFPGLPIHYGPEKWPVEELAAGPEIDLLYGNPPCAAWSVAGYTKTRGTDKWRTDSRVECTVRHFGLMKKLRPKVWVWESVTQAYTKGREFVDALTEEALAEGYSVTYLLHNSEWLGLPQTRKRFFMVCHRIAFTPKAPNWSPPPTPLEVMSEVEPGESYGYDAPKLLNFTEELLRKVKPGERLAKFWERAIADPDPAKWDRKADGTIRGRPSYGHCRLPLDRPGGAVVGYRLVHPTEPRFISIEEMQALCGFPSSFRFTPKGREAKASEMARGVMPPVGKWLAGMIAEAVDRDEPIGEPSVVEADFRSPPVDGELLVRPVARGGSPSGPDSLPLPRAAGKPRRAAHVPQPGETPQPKPVSYPRPKPDVRSGAYIRLLLSMERWTTAEVVEAVKLHYPESKATGADVGFHRDEMKKAGSPVRVVRQLADGTRKFMKQKEAQQ